MDFRRLFDLLSYQLGKYPQKVALSQKEGNHWKSYSTADVIQTVERLAAGLLDLGIKKGDKVGILADGGSPIWNFIDFALLKIGAVVVPIHATVSKKQLIFILKDAAIKHCFVDGKTLLEQLLSVKSNALTLKDIYSFQELKGVKYWRDLLSSPSESHQAKFETFKGVIHEDDLATIIYTSGTTGEPKGVMLSHQNIVSNIKATLTIVPVNCDKKVLSFLPMSHIFERMSCYFYIAAGASIHYVSNRENLMSEMKEVRPHFFTSVPRILEKMLSGILDQANDKKGFSKKVLHWAIALGERFKGDKNVGFIYWLKSIIADILVYRHWRKALGSNVEGIVVGAAHLQPRLARLFNAAGFTIREGYGLTEAAPIISFNHFEPGLFRFDSVGIPIPGIEVKIDNPNENGEGEILARGPGIMLGYHNLPEETKKVKNEEGWLRTGDVGRFIEKRFLQITDRKKDIFKTSSGKYIAPQMLENHLRSSPFIEQCLIIGFQRPFVTALIVPSFTRLKNWCEENKVHWTAPQYMVLNPKVEKMMGTEIAALNQVLPVHEQIKNFTLLHEEWTPSNGLTSHTLKVIRTAVLEKFKKEVKKMYSA